MVDTPKIDQARLSGGCGGSLDDPHFVPLDNFGGGRAQTIHVPVCGQCYPRLATAEGIAELTKKVNE